MLKASAGRPKAGSREATGPWCSMRFASTPDPPKRRKVTGAAGALCLGQSARVAFCRTSRSGLAHVLIPADRLHESLGRLAFRGASTYPTGVGPLTPRSAAKSWRCIVASAPPPRGGALTCARLAERALFDRATGQFRCPRRPVGHEFATRLHNRRAVAVVSRYPRSPCPGKP